LLLQSPEGNLLWDCISLLDQETIAEVTARGDIRAIAISHPHFYSSMVEWADHFDAQIFLHAADRQWVMRKSPRIQFWEETTLSLWNGLTLINCGGHFEGGTVLHWSAGANSKGALLTGGHHYRSAGPALREFHAQLPKSDSARCHRHSSYSRCDRTIPVRSNLRWLVESERLIRCQSRRHAIGGTLSARDRTRRELRLRVQTHRRASFCFRNRLSEFIYHYPRSSGKTRGETSRESAQFLLRAKAT
jgi:hypothetical protein